MMAPTGVPLLHPTLSGPQTTQGCHRAVGGCWGLPRPAGSGAGSVRSRGTRCACATAHVGTGKLLGLHGTPAAPLPIARPPIAHPPVIQPPVAGTGRV